jgi:AcrR family transcriptional regulator
VAKRLATESTGRRRLSRPERRRRIIDGALEVFAREGYGDAGMLDIAAAAGVTPPVVYRHFESKRTLFLAVMDDQVSRLATAIGDATDPSSASLEDRVIKTATAILNFVAERPQAWRLLRTTAPADPKIAAAYRHLYIGTRRRTAETTASDPDFTAAPGIDRRVAADLFGQLQWTAYETLGDWASENPEAQHADLIRIFMDFMWIGLEGHRRRGHWKPLGRSGGRRSPP